jgi:Kef-type K+ transport system membrane component KefB
VALFSIITDVLIVLAAALLIGEVFERLHFPSVVGELLSGIIIGPSLLCLVAPTDAFEAVSYIALFFILFHIGFELRTNMIMGKLKFASLFSLTSFLIPLGLMVLATLLFFPFALEENVILALAIAVPSLSIVSVLCWQYNLLKTITGQIILASVTMSDVLAFVILAGILRPLQSTLTVILEIIIFIVVFVAADRILNLKAEAFHKMLVSASRFFKRVDFAFAVLLIFALLMSAIFEIMGLSFILGAFFAGLIVHDRLIGKKAYNRISQTLSTMNNIFFIPLFFGFAGVEVILASISYTYYAGLAVLIALGLGIGVSLTYYVSHKIARVRAVLDVVPKQLAGILGGRGAIGIVVATIAFGEGVLGEAGFSLVILATMIMSLIIPFLAGRTVKMEPPSIPLNTDSCEIVTDETIPPPPPPPPPPPT